MNRPRKYSALLTPINRLWQLMFERAAFDYTLYADLEWVEIAHYGDHVEVVYRCLTSRGSFTADMSLEQFSLFKRAVREFLRQLEFPKVKVATSQFKVAFTCDANALENCDVVQRITGNIMSLVTNSNAKTPVVELKSAIHAEIVKTLKGYSE